MSVDGVLVVQRVRINPVFVPLQLAFCVPYYMKHKQGKQRCQWFFGKSPESCGCGLMLALPQRRWGELEGGGTSPNFS